MDTSNVVEHFTERAERYDGLLPLVYRSGLDGLCTGSLTAPE